MSPDIEQLLRDQLRGAATGAPQNLGVDDQDVLTRGRRVVVRRRVLTVAGVAAATLVIAGTIGVLGPRVNNDALPAIPTPTITPTPEATPTTTSSASPSATVKATPRATPSSTPSATATSTAKPTRTNSPTSTPSRTKTPSSTPSVNSDWTEPVNVGGVRYRGRLLNPHVEGDYLIYQAEIEADGKVIYTRREQDYGESYASVMDDPRDVFLSNVGPITGVISENRQPVTGANFASVLMPFPGTEATIAYTIIRLPRPATVNETGRIMSIVVGTAGGESALGQLED